MYSDIPSAYTKRSNGKNNALHTALTGYVQALSKLVFLPCYFPDDQPAPFSPKCRIDSLDTSSPKDQVVLHFFQECLFKIQPQNMNVKHEGFLFVCFDQHICSSHHWLILFTMFHKTHTGSCHLSLKVFCSFDSVVLFCFSVVNLAFNNVNILAALPLFSNCLDLSQQFAIQKHSLGYYDIMVF